MGLYSFSEPQILLFFASLTRVVCLFLLLPIFGDNTVPPVVRIFLAFSINLIIYPIAASSGADAVMALGKTDMGVMTLVLREAAVGFALGFIAKIFFEGMNFAFNHMGSQMGFNMAAAYDAHTESNIPVVSQLIMILAMLLFLALDGHHLFLKALAQSYEMVPVAGVTISKAIAGYVLETSSQVFWIAVKLSAPMSLMIFLINCAFGIIAKAVPQINVLVVSFTVNILAGFLVITLTLPVFGTSVSEVIQQMIGRMTQLLHLLA